ncbi:MAG: HEAT repeat domain-containing protein [Anaerolineae bacterium]|nr:HEAT repeat domain-containing protein [Anaerolineae bacterium]
MTNTFETLIAQLKSQDTLQRSTAILQLQPGTIHEEHALSALVHILCHDDDLNVVEDATWVLVRYGAAAMDTLVQHIRHEHSRARHNVVHALGKLGDAQAVPHLIAATRDADASVRLKATYALGQIGDERAIDALIDRLDDPAQDIQWTAREVLEAFGEKALPHLIHALTRESIPVRELAASLLGDLADTRAVEPLMSAADSADWPVRFAVAEALGKIGDGRALPVVQRMIDDDDPRVRAVASMTAKMLNRS